MPDAPGLKVPIIGRMNKTTALMAGGTAVVVTGYLLYKHNKTKTAAAATAGAGATGYGYGATGYGEPQGYYGYGYGYGNAGMGSGSFAPYPTGSEYGYGAYGYGYYNPYTGQWIGPQSQVPPVIPPVTTPPSASYPALPNPTLAQEQRAWAPGRPAGMKGKIFSGGKWYTVPQPPSGIPAPGPTTHTITASGNQTLAATSRANGISEWQLIAYNPNLSHLYGSGKPIPRGTRVKV